MPPEEPILPDLCRRNLTPYTYSVCYRDKTTNAIVNWMYISPNQLELYKDNCIKVYNNPISNPNYFGDSREYFVARIYFYTQDLTDKKEQLSMSLIPDLCPRNIVSSTYGIVWRNKDGKLVRYTYDHYNRADQLQLMLRDAVALNPSIKYFICKFITVAQLIDEEKGL